jgi:hypothetical protein
LIAISDLMNDWQLRRSRKTPWDAIAVVAASVLVVLLMLAGVL